MKLGPPSTALRVTDTVISPGIYLAASLLGFVRAVGIKKMPHSKSALLKAGVFPILNHYYEPLFDTRELRQPLSRERNLPGIDWNVDGQLQLLRTFHYREELEALPEKKTEELAFYLDNDMFGSGDAEFLYNMVRAGKPSRIVEIGCGHSTLIGLQAITKNRAEDPSYQCEYVCIEPYEVPWLEQTGVTVIRQPVETVPRSVFDDLKSGDILFIDSSHVVRPQGDVVFEYLELIPSLPIGVIVHVHDIFSPHDYPESWIVDEVRLWNEQYVLEAFMTSNSDWKIIGALNFLQHKHYDALSAVCPNLTPDREPGSFYMQRIS